MSSKKQLFEYCVLHHATTKNEDGKKEVVTKLIVKPTTVLASNNQTAALTVARAIPEEYVEDLDNVDICIRPF